MQPKVIMRLTPPLNGSVALIGGNKFDAGGKNCVFLFINFIMFEKGIGIELETV